MPTSMHIAILVLLEIRSALQPGGPILSHAYLVQIEVYLAEVCIIITHLIISVPSTCLYLCLVVGGFADFRSSNTGPLLFVNNDMSEVA